METTAHSKSYSVDVWEKAIFLPQNDTSDRDILLKQVSQFRQATLLAFALKLSSIEPVLFKDSGVAEFLERFKNLSGNDRRELLEYPPFFIWQKQVCRSLSSAGDLKDGVAQLGTVLAAFEKRKDTSTLLNFGERIVEVERFTIHPLIREAASSDYQLPDVKRQLEFESEVVYPRSLFLDMLAVALERIKHAWPDAYRDFPMFVKIIVDMIDANFTSYSAAEHRGVIFVSTDNSPLVALEEYLIHEFGHQILYHVMELDPLINNDSTKEYKLPWSGQVRDYYGYFHAFYIYIFMALYLSRVKGRSEREQKRIGARFSHVLDGLNKALPDLEQDGQFTAKGKQLFGNLKNEVYRLNKEIAC